MTNVLKQGTRNIDLGREYQCTNCDSVLLFFRADIRHEDWLDAEGRRCSDYYVVCPVCGVHIAENRLPAYKATEPA